MALSAVMPFPPPVTRKWVVFEGGENSISDIFLFTIAV
jgi:hypothetical protein